MTISFPLRSSILKSFSKRIIETLLGMTGEKHSGCGGGKVIQRTQEFERALTILKALRCFSTASNIELDLND